MGIARKRRRRRYPFGNGRLQFNNEKNTAVNAVRGIYMLARYQTDTELFLPKIGR